MKRKRWVCAVLLILSTAFLVACGPSKEKMAQLQQACDLLYGARQEAEESYGELTDDTLGTDISSLAKQADRIKTTNFHKMNDEEADAMLPEITALTTSYGTLQAKIDQEAKKEKDAAEAARGVTEVPAWITNETGQTLKALLLTDKSAGAKEDLLVQGQSLAPGQTLMGVVITVQKTSSAWSLTATTDTGETLSFDQLDFTEAGTDGISLILKKTDKGNSAVIGKYTANQKDATAGQSSSESGSAADSAAAQL